MQPKWLGEGKLDASELKKNDHLPLLYHRKVTLHKWQSLQEMILLVQHLSVKSMENVEFTWKRTKINPCVSDGKVEGTFGHTAVLV